MKHGYWTIRVLVWLITILHIRTADGYGGVGMYIHKSIKFAIQDIGCHSETPIITTLNLRMNFNIIVNYSPPNISIDKFNSEMLKIFSFADNQRLDSIICGDFNAKDPLWCPLQSDSKGFLLRSLVEDHHFRCLNDGSHTFDAGTRTPSSLDVTFTNITRTSISWRVLNINTQQKIT